MSNCCICLLLPTPTVSLFLALPWTAFASRYRTPLPTAWLLGVRFPRGRRNVTTPLPPTSWFASRAGMTES